MADPPAPSPSLPPGRLIPGSPADRCGQLYKGDILLGVNYQDVTNIEHSDVVSLIKNALTIRLVVEYPGDKEGGQREGLREIGGGRSQVCIMIKSRSCRSYCDLNHVPPECSIPPSPPLFSLLCPGCKDVGSSCGRPHSTR